MVLRGRKDKKQWARGQHKPLEEPESEPVEEASVHEDDGGEPEAEADTETSEDENPPKKRIAT